MPCEIEIRENTAWTDRQLTGQRSILNTGDEKELKILVAEDNDGNYLLVERILKDYTLTRVLNGVDAVKKILEEKFDLVFMDLKMPIMGGLEATRKIREFNTQIPIVALTANAFDSDRVSAIEAGCNAFLAKPVKRSQLLELFSKKW